VFPTKKAKKPKVHETFVEHLIDIPVYFLGLLDDFLVMINDYYIEAAEDLN